MDDKISFQPIEELCVEVQLLKQKISDLETKLDVAIKEIVKKPSNGPDIPPVIKDYLSKRGLSQTDGIEPSEVKRAKHHKYDFTIHNDHIVVYTDGCCTNNGRNGAKAGIGVWFGNSHPLNCSKPVQGKATNNVAEIQACICALEISHKAEVDKVRIVTDSQFTINCITKWMNNWKRNNWHLSTGRPVKNQPDLIKLDHIQQLFSSVQWEHVNGHRGVHGNEEADKLARLGAVQYR